VEKGYGDKRLLRKKKVAFGVERNTSIGCEEKKVGTLSLRRLKSRREETGITRTGYGQVREDGVKNSVQVVRTPLSGARTGWEMRNVLRRTLARAIDALKRNPLKSLMKDKNEGWELPYKGEAGKN